ncbi:MAG TPA: 1-(5-phosphoribosyl)-5-[(5-phosphoribosylamino)methylideneamino]imidazole-4-carboxamide isomerase [Woeseiaceae bacterium]|nr:1-(5-phosphoribosyl)-5-[(5-phosphoribosylamino)methylideneamino]imidazole-4-carboxamide isomerase [Woeseiaceae bacterium]
MQIIPAIDLRQGRCVRLLQGDYARETVYGDKPLQIAAGLRELGFTSLHVVDLDGARSGNQDNAAIVRDLVSATGLAVQLGGGIRDAATLRDWLNRGVERCVLGSVAIDDPDRVRSWIKEVGPDRIVLALDVRLTADGQPQLATQGWTRASGITLWQCLDGYLGCGLARVLCTDIGRDGTMTGPNLELYRQILCRYPGLILQASGGVRHAADLVALREAGIHAAITGRALLDGCIRKQEIKKLLRVA